MPIKIDEKNLRKSRITPDKMIPYWIEYMEINDSKDRLEVKTRNLDFHKTLVKRIESHIGIVFLDEDEPQTFNATEVEGELIIIFSGALTLNGGLEDALELLDEQKAFSPETYQKALNILNPHKEQKEECKENPSKDSEEAKYATKPSPELNITPTTQKISLSQSADTFFANETKNSTTPPSPTGKKSCSL